MFSDNTNLKKNENVFIKSKCKLSSKTYIDYVCDFIIKSFEFIVRKNKINKAI